MSKKNTILRYAFLLILSIKEKTFEGMGRIINRDGDMVKRNLPKKEKSVLQNIEIAKKAFENCSELKVLIDDTLINKQYSKKIEGTAHEYSSSTGAIFIANRILVFSVTDGKQTFIIDFLPMYKKEKYPNLYESRLELTKKIILRLQEIFKSKKLIFVMDGAFATIELIEWLNEKNICADMRFRKNSVVEYNGKKVKICDIQELHSNKKAFSKVVFVKWNKLNVFIMRHSRINKNGEINIVYQISTYLDKAKRHIESYKLRWNIEKFFRTAKQKLGLMACQSCKNNVQVDHIGSTFLAYNYIQLEMFKRKIEIPEECIRYLQKKKSKILNSIF